MNVTPNAEGNGWYTCPACHRYVKQFIENSTHRTNFCPFCGNKLMWEPEYYKLTIGKFSDIVEAVCKDNECGTCPMRVEGNCASMMYEIVETTLKNLGAVDEDGMFTEKGNELLEKAGERK